MSTSRPRLQSNASSEARILARLRRVCLGLADATETVTFCHPTFQVRKRSFCVLEEYAGELCIVFKAELPVQQALIQGPRFFAAPYSGKHGWTSLRAGARLDWAEIADLVGESWRLVAPEALLAPPAETAVQARSGAKRRRSVTRGQGAPKPARRRTRT